MDYGFITALSAFVTVSSVAASERGNINDFYRGFELTDITQKNMQLWPYYKYTSTRWDEYGIFGTTPIMASSNPPVLTTAKETFDFSQEFKDGRSFVDSLLATQTKG
ncbi:MAG: hypothetical protein ACR2O8_14435, partial [Rhizobiaceae bacterium]